MKIWQKNFLCSLILFIVMFNLSAYLLIENSHNLNLKREIDKGLNEQLSIYSGLQISYPLINESLDDSSNEYIYVSINEYLDRIKGKNIYLEVLDEKDNKIFSNFNLKVDGTREELQNPLIDKRKYIIRDVENKTLLFVTNLLKIGPKNFKFTYITDISHVYQQKHNQYKFFIQMNIIITIILAIGLYLLSKFITNPIEELVETTKIIAKGNFSKRVKIKNKNDEIGILGKKFNEMAYVVEEKIDELKESSQKKQRFIDSLTHELKTPLTSIIGYSSLLLNTKCDEKLQHKALNYIYTESKRLERLSLKMMDLILINEKNLEKQNESLKEILSEVQNSLYAKLKNKNIDLIIHAEDCKIFVEKDLFEILLMNLIDNSIKASKEGDKILISVYDDSSNKIIEIKDQGIGIPKEDLYKVIEPFYMVDKARSRSNNGIGLGLAICTQIVKIHDIKLNIDSELNKGTTIKIIL